MAKAYKCDICDKVFEGITEMQVILSKGVEIVLRFTLGIKISPQNDQANTYTKDLCPDCTNSFVQWFRFARKGLSSVTH